MGNIIKHMNMKKLKKMPKFTKEIAGTVISYAVLCVLWALFIGEYIQISDQGLSTIGIAVSTSLGVLTAIVVSFALIVWQTSRRDRSESFLRWRNVLHQLFEFYDANMENYMEIREEIKALTQEASAVASIAPMNRNRCRDLVSAISNKITEDAEQSSNIRNPSNVQVEKARIGKYIGDYLVMLAHANLDHNIAHYLYYGLLRLRQLLYRLLFVLAFSIVIVTLAVTTTTARISDIINTPLAIVLVSWVIYVLIHLGIEVKRFTRFEDELRRQEDEARDFPIALR